jgi:Bacterial archaeo-eukaryotic release factor family 11
MPDFGDKLTRSLLHDWRGMPQLVPSGDADRALDEHIHAGRDLARQEQRLAGCVAPYVAEPAKPIDSLRRKLWEQATRRPSFHVRAPRRRLQNIEGEKVLLHEYVRKVEQAIHGVLAGSNRPLVLAAAEPLVSMFRSVNSYPRLANEMIEGNPDLMTDAELEDAAIPVDLFAQELKTVIALYDELKPERATTDVFLCRARGNRRRRRSTSRRLRRGCSRPRQRHRRQRHLFGFR